MSLYPKLAKDCIKKNRKLYIPFIMTTSLMIMVSYIVMYLVGMSESVFPAGALYIETFLMFGFVVLSIFAVIFLFYTNSLLLKRRKKEFGLYNVLGMTKKNIGKIYFFETFDIYAISLLIGFGTGILVSKLAELLLVRLVGGEVLHEFSISKAGLGVTTIIYAFIFLLIFLNGIRQIRKNAAISLVNSDNYGEKPPKANAFLAILGFVILVIAYIISCTIESPFIAIFSFFGAVTLVVIATYMLMTAGSVFMCKLLQKNESYYYKPNHFVSVSSMAYRMKRNGAGLASICILCTMVLVVISVTTCLYAGFEKTLNNYYPNEMNVYTVSYNKDDMKESLCADRFEAFTSAIKDEGYKFDSTMNTRCAETFGIVQDGKIQIATTDNLAATSVIDLLFIPIEDYNKVTGESLTLDHGEVYVIDGKFDGLDELTVVDNGMKFKIKGEVDEMVVAKTPYHDIVTSCVIYVKDFDELDPLRDIDMGYEGVDVLSYCQYCGYDMELDEEEAAEVINAIDAELEAFSNDDNYFSIQSRTIEYPSLIAFYGSFFFLGILMSSIFLVATVLIIYYKQISEGYEDQNRFRIMKKVGMTKREIKKSINSQILTVFFLPLGMACLHLAFAFPSLNKILSVFNMGDMTLFVIVTLISALIFGLIYIIIYKITSNTYYSIVSE